MSIQSHRRRHKFSDSPSLRPEAINDCAATSKVSRYGRGLDKARRQRRSFRSGRSSKKGDKAALPLGHYEGAALSGARTAVYEERFPRDAPEISPDIQAKCGQNPASA